MKARIDWSFVTLALGFVAFLFWIGVPLWLAVTR